jgi:hypothetical protein
VLRAHADEVYEADVVTPPGLQFGSGGRKRYLHGKKNRAGCKDHECAPAVLPATDINATSCVQNDAQHAELVHQATTPQQVQRCVTYQIDRQAALASAVEALVQAVAALPHTLVIAHSGQEQRATYIAYGAPCEVTAKREAFMTRVEPEIPTD